MNDTDKIVAAIFAAAYWGPNAKHEEYLAQYETFLQKMVERQEGPSSEFWKKLGAKA